MPEKWCSLVVDHPSQHQAETSCLPFLISSLLLPFPATMSSNEPTAEVLQSLFRTWLKSSSTPVSSDALYCLVLDLNIPSIVRARSTYGHFHSARWTKSPGHIRNQSQKLSSTSITNPFVSIHIHSRILWSIYRLCTVIPWVV
jgi:hypothetical protein